MPLRPDQVRALDLDPTATAILSLLRLPQRRVGRVSLNAKLPAELHSLIDAHITGFNTQNPGLFLSVFGDTAVIIDGIAPYRWLNPDAPAHWLADVEKWRKAHSVVEEHLSYEIGFSNLEGAHAYALILGTLTIRTTAQSIIRTGTLAYTFAKRRDKWKIEAQAWGRTA